MIFGQERNNTKNPNTVLVKSEIQKFSIKRNRKFSIIQINPPQSNKYHLRLIEPERKKFNIFTINPYSNRSKKSKVTYSTLYKKF